MAKKAKTVKYYIGTVIADSFETRTEVNKSAFEKTYQKAQKQFEEQMAKEGDEFYVERYEKKTDHETYTEKYISFNWSINAAQFIILTCKEGYRFTK